MFLESELRLYLRRDSLRDGNDCSWVLRGDDGRIAASGSSLENLPPARHCRLVLAAELVNLVPASLPDLPPHKLQALLPAAAENHALQEAEQLHVAWMGRDELGISWLAVVDRPWFQQTLRVLKERGVEPDVVLPEALLLPNEEGAWSVLRNEEGALVRCGMCVAHALDHGELPAGLGLALAHASPRPTRIDVYRGSALHPMEGGRWEVEYGIPVRDRGAWAWRDASWPLGLNLLQGDMQPRHGRLDWNRLARTLVFGMALLGSVQLAGVTLDWAMLVREQRQLQSDMRGLAERALPAHSAIVDPAWQVGEHLKAQREARGEGEAGLLALLSRIGSTWPAGLAAAKEMEYRDGVVSLSFGPGDRSADLEMLKSGLASAGFVVTVESESGGQTLQIRQGNASGRTGGKHGN